MHAHINVWRANDAGSGGSDRLARQVAAHLRQQPGFHSYTFVKTGDAEFVAITLFETNAQLHAALDSLGEDIRENLDHVTEGRPEHHAGDVLVHEMV
ncbi:MAG: antibiotic biosynthesis monooxygenase [Chloroflexota bacterium]|nr:antibiotic biosynthesis monooxygenase [Chloroflexota bacterium]